MKPTEGRNVKICPAYADWDFALLKNFSDRIKADPVPHGAIHILNHANFRLPDCDISSPAFNNILAANASRQVQFALKFMN